MVMQKQITPKDRKTDEEMAADWEKVRPQVLGMLLDAVSMAIRRRPEITMEEKPRMADFCMWAEAAGPTFGWEPDEFL